MRSNKKYSEEKFNIPYIVSAIEFVLCRLLIKSVDKPKFFGF